MAYSGLYRAKVVQHGDERQKGRIKVTIPDISGGKSKSQWVDLCMNCAYEEGGDIAVPKLGDTCWIAFERGDINLPVYMGNFFGAFKTPLPDYDEDTRVISWDSCRIEMKGETMKFIVGEKSLITITTDSITLQVGENSEGVLDMGGDETSNPQRESSNGGGKSTIILTQENIMADSTAITVSAKTMACIRATSEMSIMGKHIGLNDGAAFSAMKMVPVSNALSMSNFTSSFGSLPIKDVLNNSTFNNLAEGMTDSIKSFGSNALGSVLKSTGVMTALENSNLTSVLDNSGSLNEILSLDTRSNLASNTVLLSSVGGLDNLNSMLDTGKFSDLVDMPDISDALTGCGILEYILPEEIIEILKDDSTLQENLGLQILKDTPFTEAVQIDGVAEALGANDSFLTDILSEKGMSRASQNDEFVSVIMEERYQEKIKGDTAFEDFDAKKEIERLSDENFLVIEEDEEIEKE